MSTALDRITFAAREGRSFYRYDVIELLRQHRILLETARNVVVNHTDPESPNKAASIRSLKDAIKDCDGESKTEWRPA